MLYGEKQPHGLSKRLPTNELKDKTKYSDTNTEKDKVHGKTKTVARIETRNTAGIAFTILCNVFDFLFENIPPE